MLRTILKTLCEAKDRNMSEIIEHLHLTDKELDKEPSIHRCVQLGEVFNMSVSDIKLMSANSAATPPKHEYTVCFLFNENLTHVLLQRKMKTDFAGLLNGVGGALRPNETREACALREIQEETGVKPEDIVNLGYLGTLTLPYDCKTQENIDCVLHYFTGVVKESLPSPQPGEPELLEWHNTNYVQTMSVTSAENYFAGNGDLQFFVHMGIKYHIANKSTDKIHTLQKGESDMFDPNRTSPPDELHDNTQNHKCTHCGECCSRMVTLTATDINRIRRYIKTNNITPEDHTKSYMLMNMSAKPTIDLTCPFLKIIKPGTENNSQRAECKIYPVRPAVCRSFTCEIASDPKKSLDICRNLSQILTPLEMTELSRKQPVDMLTTFFP